MSGRCQSEPIAINQNIYSNFKEEHGPRLVLMFFWLAGGVLASLEWVAVSQSVADHIFHRGVYFRSIDRSVVIKLQIGNGRQVICETFSDTKVAANP